MEYAVFHHIIFDPILNILEQEQCTISLLQAVIAVSLSFLYIKTLIIARIIFIDVLVYVLCHVIVLKSREVSGSNTVVN